MRNQHFAAGFYGTLLSHYEFRCFKLSETGYEGGTHLPVHSHERSYFSMTMQGNYREGSERTSNIVSPLTLAFHPAGVEHFVDFDCGEARLFNIEIQADWIKRLRESQILLDQPAYYRGGRPSWLALRLYKEYKSMDTLSVLMIEALLLELIVETSRSAISAIRRRVPDWLRNARELLHNNFAQNLSLKEIADNVDVHPVHLATSFRRYYGTTIGDYVRKRRIDFACAQILDSNRPLTEIAVSSGFFDQSHFSRTFKQVVGVTPSEYRFAFQKNES